MNKNITLLSIAILSIFCTLSLAQKTDQKIVDTEIQQEIQDSIQYLSNLGPFLGSLLANIFSEFGDKTFIIAAVMAMKFQRLPVFIGACGALMFMTMIGCIFGYYLPTVLSPTYTSMIAGILLLFFGGKLLYEAYKEGQNGDESSDGEEKEIEKEVSKIKKQIGEDKQQQKKQSCLQQLLHLFNKQNSYIMMAGFSQVFFGEWGDRSQLTTIALAADNDAFLVFLGSAVGQSICTLIAVMGGKYLAKKVSERMLNIGSGILMLVFAVHAFFK